MSKVVLIIILVFVVFVLFFFFKKERPNELQYYNDLLSQCSGQEDNECCTSSVVTMTAGEYKLADASGQCVDGLSATTAECEGSLTWCE